ncbi:polysaccharide deacetylase family protein [Mucilaginibacter arboris]|uniref:Polysaccharide deacetylase family protein n=1 Tax=Mucilaginibacter arboris TaxID=2682090 RepID=A0A7K1SXV7_9SPHI|nr:polysaccharide deacetylase family protein [Mucilaginibacter arboris]MVN22143.1 polysaccharide deacetylase family protein [Mucilaginibacter arboris]
MKIITTSWDDGYPQDLKLADLLDKYNLPATFYIPKTNQEHVVMDEKTIVALSKRFELGGHTLNHVRLYSNMQAGLLENEIQGCYNWIKDLQGYNPTSFCFPGGVLNKASINAVYNSGFKMIRTTELLSTAVASTYNLSPTTLQVFEHPRVAYLKNTIKRSQYKNLIAWLTTSCTTDILKLTDIYINRVMKNDGCFHLWGHSWEIEKYNLWQKLEMVFNRISNISKFKYLQNKDLI